MAYRGRIDGSECAGMVVLPETGRKPYACLHSRDDNLPFAHDPKLPTDNSLCQRPWVSGAYSNVALMCCED